MKPVAVGSVVVRAPMVDVEEEFARTLGADASTVIERTAEGEYRATSKAGLARVVQQFTLEPAGDAETTVDAAIYIRPAWVGWMVRRVMRRRRLENGVNAALQRMARAASGEPEPEPEFGPEDFERADDEEPTTHRDE
jgi:hypothetical protein